MRYLIASDIHGSAYYAEKLLELSKTEMADKIILLGDIYNHGPRNPLPKDYNPMKVSEILNSITEKLIVIKGNCDSQVDTLISDFDFCDTAVIEIDNKTIFLNHGHLFNKDKMPKTKYNAMIYGHFHTGFIIEEDSTLIANAGSLSLPKDKTQGTYIIIDNNTLTLKEIDGKVLAEKSF